MTEPTLTPGGPQAPAEELPVGQAQHAGPQRREGQRRRNLRRGIEPEAVDRERLVLVRHLATGERVAPLRGTPADKVEVEYRNQAQRILCIAGLCGLPQISLPMATLDGSPLGLSLLGALGSDRGLLALAKRILA